MKIYPALSVILDTEAILEQIISQYDLKRPQRCYFYQKGYRDKYIVEVEDKKYFLFVYREKLRSQVSLLSELEITSHLFNNGFSVYSPLKKRDGSPLTQIDTPEGSLLLVLFEPSQEEHFTEMNSDRCFKSGQRAAQMHLVLDNLKKNLEDVSVIDFRVLFTEPLEILKPLLSISDYKYLWALGKDLQSKIQELLPEEQPQFGLCHGNLQPLPFIDKMEKVVFADCNWLGRGWRAFDMSSFLWSVNLLINYNDWSDEVVDKREKIWKAFLAGYTSKRVLAEEELYGVIAFLPFNILRRLAFHVNNKYGTVGWDPMSEEYIASKVIFIRKLVKNYKICG